MISMYREGHMYRYRSEIGHPNLTSVNIDRVAKGLKGIKGNTYGQKDLKNGESWLDTKNTGK